MTDYFHLNAAPDTVRAISSLGLAHLMSYYRKSISGRSGN